MASKTAVIQWYLDREGKISYAKNKAERFGPDTYDSASAMLSALIAGYYLPYGTTLGSMSFLYQLDNVLLYEISRNEIQAGDIFISGFRRDYLTDQAFTGVALDFHRVIYCIESADGIVQSTNHGWSNRSVKWYRLTEPTVENYKMRKVRRGRRLFVK